MPTVNLGDEGLSQGSNIVPYLSTHVQSGYDIEIPAGTYDWNGNLRWDGLSDCTVEAIGGQAVLQGPNYHDNSVRIRNTGDVTFRGLTFKGVRRGEERGNSTRVDVLGGQLTFEWCAWPDGTKDYSDAHAMYLGDSDGILRLEDCYMEGFGDNGLYASAPGSGGGPVQVVRGVYRNNNISNIRLGTPNSYVRNAFIEINQSQVPHSFNELRGSRGVRIDNPAHGAVIEDCDIVTDSNTHGAIQNSPEQANAQVTLRNNRIRQDGSAPALYNTGNGNYVGSGNHLTGSGDLTFPSSLVACRGSSCLTPQQREWSPPVGGGGNGGGGDPPDDGPADDPDDTDDPDNEDPEEAGSDLGGALLAGGMITAAIAYRRRNGNPFED